MADWKDNISFVLIEPKEAGNIGAAARAIKNTGFKNLELVRPKKFLTDEARRMAYNSIDVLEKAKVCSSFEDAIKDKCLIVGTTRRIGRQRGLILPLKEGAKRIISVAKRNRVALLFGREDRGLNNREVEECGFMVTIPTDMSSPSMNLAQSVLLVAYEVSLCTFKTTSPEVVKREDLESLYKHLESALKLLEYITRGNRDMRARIMRNLKRLFNRAGLMEWEVKMLHGICSQIEKKIKE